MAKEKFNWKSLFIQETENVTQKTEPVVQKNIVLESKVTFPAINTLSNDTVPNEILSRVIEMYEKGFDSLNQSGYDFYEFFKAVMVTDPNNTQSYIMAYTMANSMDKSITKTSLLSSGEFYLTEISKVYTKYDEEGQKIKNNLINEQRIEKEKLQSEVKEIQNKIIALQAALEQKTKLLQTYDSDNSGKVKEVEQKIVANNLAKDRITQKISQVISGINNHI
jgi:hypothetical protein